MSTLKSILFFLACIKLALGSPICDAENGTAPSRRESKFKRRWRKISHLAVRQCACLYLTSRDGVSWLGLDIYTPTRIEPHMVDNCNRFFYVTTGEYCSIIAYHIVRTTGYNITTQQIIDWNGLDKECRDLRLYYYACVGVSARSPANADGSTESPSAVESRSYRGMLSCIGIGICVQMLTWPGRLGGECIEWAFTKYGHSTCERIAMDFDISVAQLQEWNPETNCNPPLREGWVCTRK